MNFLPTEQEPHLGRANHQRVRALAQVADVRVFCLSAKYPWLKFLHSRNHVRRNSELEPPKSGETIEHLSYLAAPGLSRLINGWNGGWALKPRIREFKPDVIVGYFVYPVGFAARQAGRELGVPTIVGAVGSDLRRTGQWVRPLVAQTVQKADFVLTVGEELRQRAITMGAVPQRCRTIYDGCDTDIFHWADRTAARDQLSVPQDAELIVFVGNLIPLKGARELLEATALLIRQRPKLQLAYVGAGSLEQALRQRASELDLRQRVKLTGGLKPQDVAKWMIAGNLLCLPSHSEGVPNVIAEALCCGRAVVATEVGGVPELVNEKCGILVPPRNPHYLAKALAAALDRAWNEREIARCFSRTWRDWARETHEVCCLAVEAQARCAS